MPGLGQPAAAAALSGLQQQQLMLQRQQQAASAGAAASSQRAPAKQPGAIARPAAVFPAGTVRPPSPAPGAAQQAARPAVSAADMIPAAKRKKRKLMDNRLPEKVLAPVVTHDCCASDPVWLLSPAWNGSASALASTPSFCSPKFWLCPVFALLYQFES